MSAKPKLDQIPKQVKVAKDLLDLLTGAMYVNPFSALREYIQNSVDAIEDAAATGILATTSQGRIDISVSPENRSIVIRDNGVGCANKEFTASLTAFGGSDKRGRDRRGFRGIGRLAGLAYCRELAFRGRAAGDSRVFEMVWDCVKLKELLYSDDKDLSLNQTVHSVVRIRELKASEFPEHFFEVSLRGIVRYKNDDLLNTTALREYLSQVAPVPFSPEFSFGQDITNFLSHHLGNQSFNIYFDSDEEPLFKPHRNTFQAKADISSHFSKVEFIELPGNHQDIDAVGWIIHHEYLGAISPDQIIGGLRLRLGNIQIGTSDVLRTIFPQPRFNEWCCGEIHILNHKIRPNGRRDNLEFNAHVSNLYDKLRPIGASVARKCREFSNTRSALNRFDKECTNSEYLMDLLAEGYFKGTQADKYFSYLDNQESQLMEMVAQLGEHLADGATLKRRLANWRRKRSNSVRKMKRSNLSSLVPKSKISTYHRVFEAIYDESRDKIEAVSLIRRVAEMARG